MAGSVVEGESESVVPGVWKTAVEGLRYSGHCHARRGLLSFDLACFTIWSQAHTKLVLPIPSSKTNVGYVCALRSRLDVALSLCPSAHLSLHFRRCTLKWSLRRCTSLCHGRQPVREWLTVFWPASSYPETAGI